MRNECFLTGRIAEPFHPFEDAGTHEHLAYDGEKLYETILEAARNSGTIDKVRVVVPESMLKENMPERVHITGAFQSMNDSRHKLILYIRVKNLEATEELHDENRLEFNGNICKIPIVRKTPLGRKIADLLLANNQYEEIHGKTKKISSYIPSICWNKGAEMIGAYSVGDTIYVRGRIQSREHDKTDIDGNVYTTTVYEFSIDRIIKHRSGKRKKMSEKK